MISVCKPDGEKGWAFDPNRSVDATAHQIAVASLFHQLFSPVQSVQPVHRYSITTGEHAFSYNWIEIIY